MLKINSYSLSGTKTSVNLPKIFQEKNNPDLLAQAMRVYQDRSHPGLSKVKTRGEVSKSTAKIWRQKGTGRARHGARSAPIFVGGGVAHGPKGIKRILKMSGKMSKKSLSVALSVKAKSGEIAAVSNLSKIVKTKDAHKLIKTVMAKEDLNKLSGISLVLESENIKTAKSFRNLPNVRILNAVNLNAGDVFFGGFIIFEKEALDFLAGVKGVKKDAGERKVVAKVVKETGVPKKRALAAGKNKKGSK